MLFKFAVLRVQDTHLAEDLVQETLVKAFQSYDRFRHESSVRTWLFQILRNEINSHFRKASTARRATTRDEEISMSDLLCPRLNNDEFRTAVEREEFWDVIQKCFERVPEHLLETFLFRLANPGEKADRLSNELGVSASNFSVRIFRARLMLRRCVESNWLREKSSETSGAES